MSELEEMRSFVQLIESGSATRAAEVRGLAASAISRRLKDLETRLGVQLLVRTTRSMTLTDEGRMFYDRCVRLLSDLADAEAEVMRASKTLSGTLKIAAPLSFGIAHLAPALSAFMHAHPEITITLDMSDRRVDLVEEGFDLAIRIGRLEDSSLLARRIAGFRHVVCAAPAYLKAHGAPKFAEELEGRPGLCYANLPNPARWEYVAPDGQHGSVRVIPRLIANNGDALREAAIAGHGLLCEPSFIVHTAIEAGQLKPLLLDYRWYDMAIHAVYPPTRHLSQRVRRLIDFLTDRFGEEPYWEAGIARLSRA